VVINGAPPRREAYEAPAVTYTRDSLARLDVPVWGGQISHRANLSLSLAKGEGAKEYDAACNSTAEIARLWGAIEKSVQAIRHARDDSGAMHRVAA